MEGQEVGVGVRARKKTRVTHHAWRPLVTVVEATSGGSGGGGHQVYGTLGGGIGGELLREVARRAIVWRSCRGGGGVRGYTYDRDDIWEGNGGGRGGGGG